MKRNKKILLVLILLLLMITLSGCAKAEYIQKELGNGFGFWDIFVYPMAGIMWCVGKTIGFHNYGLTIIFSTLIVRTIAWPIYAKTNDMQLKMQIMQPEIDKLQAKYANRTDPESQQRLKMEQMQIYKKYGVGLGGCLGPLIQMPIFLGFYYALSKLPASIAIEGHWLNIFESTKLLGVDLTLTRTAEIGFFQFGSYTTQDWGVFVLALLSGLTQLMSIIISNARQKKQKEEQQAGIPEYRRKQNQNSEAQATAGTMKIMLYVFALLMVLIVIRNTAGLGLYWTVGNLYSTLQTYFGQKTANKRLEKLKKKGFN